LSGEKESCVLICPTCGSAWRPAGEVLQPVACALAADGPAADLYVPFWRMATTVTGIAMQTYADLARHANLPRAILPAWERQRLFFWAPAFKIQPPVFLRLARHVTFAQPDEGESTDFKGRRLHPVTLPPEEAAQSIMVVLADTAKRRREIHPLLARAQVRVDSCRIVYLPFTRRAGDFVQKALGFGIQESALHFGAGL